MGNFKILTIKDIMATMPHKFKNAKNATIIMEAYLKQYNQMVKTLMDILINFDINKATGDMLDKIGTNVMTLRKSNENDDDYRNRIKLAYITLKVSGNIKNFSTVFNDYLNIDKDVLQIKELGNANVSLEFNRESGFDSKMVLMINEIIRFSKPVGVGFSIDPYSSVVILDTYKDSTVDAIFDFLSGWYIIDEYNNATVDLVKYPVTHRYLKEIKKYQHKNMSTKTHEQVRFDRNN